MMNYSHTLTIHYSFKNFLIVDGCGIFKRTQGRGVCFNQKIESHI